METVELVFTGAGDVDGPFDPPEGERIPWEELDLVDPFQVGRHLVINQDKRLAQFAYPKVSDSRREQFDYESMRERGESHNIAKMCALQQAPRLVTDNTWNTGRVNNNQFANCPGLGNYFKSIAEAQGVSTTGKYYVHGLGRYPGDPKAWCRSRHDAVAIAKERNLNLTGMVTHKAHEVEPAPDVPLAEDLWEGYAQQAMAQDPGLSYEDARGQAFDRHAYRPEYVKDREDFSAVDVESSFRETLAQMEATE